MKESLLTRSRNACSTCKQKREDVVDPGDATTRSVSARGKAKAKAAGIRRTKSEGGSRIRRGAATVAAHGKRLREESGRAARSASGSGPASSGAPMYVCIHIYIYIYICISSIHNWLI